MVPEDRRRQQKSWQENLHEGNKQRVMLKGSLSPPTIQTSGSPSVTSIRPTSVDVWICEIDDADNGSGRFRRIIVTDQVVTVAVFDPSLPSTASNTDKSGAYGMIEVIDGIPELTWVGC